MPTRGAGFYLGLDFGTSGARAIAIDDEGEGEIRASHAVRFEPPRAIADWFDIWRGALDTLLTELDREVRANLTAIAIDGTSSTVFLTDATGQPVGEPLLYNDDRARSQLDRVAAIAPENHPTRSATSSLAKFCWLLSADDLADIARTPYYFCHQADWLATQLHGTPGISDYNNALKFGYDPALEVYPDWLRSGLSRLFPSVRIAEADRTADVILPRVLAPGAPISPVTPAIAHRYGLPEDCTVVAGTTDSIASFLASGQSQPGDAVTALGSTLAVKLLSRARIDSARYGIYSHRLGNLWLAGGASNTGGAVLRQFFSDRELAELSATLPANPSDLDYYPLPAIGERFPINDPQLAPRLTPRPDDLAVFLHGLLDSMARIEALGYQRLCDLGADRLRSVQTAGGGAQNQAWQHLRSQRLGVPVRSARVSEAAYGAAYLARGI